MEEYRGYEIVKMNDNELAEFYSEGIDLELKENQYLIIQNKAGEYIDYYRKEGNELKKVNYSTITNQYIGTIKPQDFAQRCAIDMLKNEQSKVKVVRGVYGSGKDYLMFHQALSLLEKGKFNKIIYIRPNVSVKDVPEIGFLKGDTDDKLGWTLAPLYDKVGGEGEINRLVNEDKLEMVPLLFIRGRSFENSLVYVTEGQNMTGEIASLILGRIGEGSELWINGDTHQTDHRVYDKDNGITKMVNRLSGNKLFSYIYLPVTHRSSVAELCRLMED